MTEGLQDMKLNLCVPQCLVTPGAGESAEELVAWNKEQEAGSSGADGSDY